MLYDHIFMSAGVVEDEDDGEGWSGSIDYGTCFME